MTSGSNRSNGPLQGLRVVEFAGIGPGPFAAMMLADMGADVIRIDRPPAGQDSVSSANDFMSRGRRSLAMNLKSPEAVEVALQIIDSADALIEGFRPGVMERLGLGPDVCSARNPGLVYGRMTGWGQSGPLAHSAGHDLNYIALTGALWATGDVDRPPSFPMNLLGDFGGGGMYLAYGLVVGMLKAQRTGHGDVVDAAICDGTNSLMTFIHAWRAQGNWQDQRAANLLDGGVPWYSVYTCADGKWITVAALELKFWHELLNLLGIDLAAVGEREDKSQWPEIRLLLTEKFASQPRDFWAELFAGSDACVAPVLNPAEARFHSHMAARNAFAPQGADQPMPAPRFTDCQTALPMPAVAVGSDSVQILEEIGINKAEIQDLLSKGIVSTVDDKQ